MLADDGGTGHCDNVRKKEYSKSFLKFLKLLIFPGLKTSLHFISTQGHVKIFLARYHLLVYVTLRVLMWVATNAPLAGICYLMCADLSGHISPLAGICYLTCADVSGHICTPCWHVASRALMWTIDTMAYVSMGLDTIITGLLGSCGTLRLAVAR